MFSRPAMLKHTFKSTLNYLKVESAANIHLCCTQELKLPSQSNKSTHIKTCRASAFSSVLQARYESTNTLRPPALSNERITGLDPIPEPPSIPEPPLAMPSATPSDAATNAIQGFGHEPPFSELGLGGWTPPGMIQSCLEYFHVDLGLPWWQAVVVGTILIRALMFPVVIMAQRNMAKLTNNMPQMQHLQAKTTDARNRGDKLEVARATAEMMKFMKEKDVNPLKNLIPPVLQAPVFISVFMGLRKMTNLPVESLKTGGILWFVDLTVQDQFYLLPVITSATLYCTIKLGADGSPGPTQNFMMKYFMIGLPVLILPFTFSFPGLILVYWTTSNFVSLVQVGILKIPRVREYFKIEKRIKHIPSTLAVKDKGFLGNLKEAWNNMKISSELQERERVDRMAFMKAGREPIKKTYKYDPTKVKPAIQAKKS